MKIGEQIKLFRIEYEMTQKELGEMCHMPDSQIRKYELGKLTPKVETLSKILDCFGILYFIKSEKKDSKITNAFSSSDDVFLFDLDNNQVERFDHIKDNERILELLNTFFIADETKDPYIKKIGLKVKLLNKKGKIKLLEYLNDLIDNPNYAKQEKK